MESLTLEEVAAAAGGRIAGESSGVAVEAVGTDSRRVRGGELFVALRGERFDGHRFVGQALAAGARAALVDEQGLPEATASLAASGQGPGQPTGPLVVVPDDTLAALHRLAGWYRGRFDIQLVGVTGSVGKTTTKDMLAGILSQRLRTVKSEANFNNEIGVPLAIFQLDRTHEAAVLELGMRGPGQIRRLASVAWPTVGVVTNVGEVHLELLGSLEAVATAKAELVEALPPGGVAVLNADDSRVRGMAARARCRVVFYGLGPGAAVRGSEVEPLGLEGVQFTIHWGGTSRRLRVPLPGAHNVYNALAAAGAALACGLGLDAVEAGLLSFSPTGMRMQVLAGLGEHAGVTVIHDAYNASPPSMRSALETLRQMGRRGGGRSVAVLGDMLELGPVEDQAHREIGQLVAKSGVDLLVAVGPLGARIAEAAAAGGLDPGRIFRCADAREAARRVPTLVRPGDTVLVKASRGVRLEAVVEALTGEGGAGH